MEGQNNNNFGTDQQRFSLHQRAWPYRDYPQHFNDGAFNFAAPPYPQHYPPVPDTPGQRDIVVDPRLQEAQAQVSTPQTQPPPPGATQATESHDDESSKKRKGGRPRKEPLPPPPEPEPKKEDPRIRYSTLQRLHVLALLAEGLKISYVSERTKVPQMTVRRIGKKAFQRGYRPDEDATILEKYVVDGKITGRPPKRKAKDMEGDETGADAAEDAGDEDGEETVEASGDGIRLGVADSAEGEGEVEVGAETEAEGGDGDVGDGGDVVDGTGLFGDALQPSSEQ